MGPQKPGSWLSELMPFYSLRWPPTSGSLPQVFQKSSGDPPTSGGCTYGLWTGDQYGLSLHMACTCRKYIWPVRTRLKMCKAPVKLSSQQTNTKLFTSWKPFLSPNQQCQSTEGKSITFHGLAPQTHQENFIIVLTSKGSWICQVSCHPSDASIPLNTLGTAL